MSKGIIVAGNMIMDVIKTIESYPPRLSLTAITNMEHSIGGAVCNCGIDLAKIDPELPVTALGAVGEDSFGKTIIERLASHKNINTSHIITKGQTSFTDVMIEEKSGNRTFFTYKGADSSFSAENVPFDKLEGSLLHIGYIMLLDRLDSPDREYGTAMARLLHNARERGLKTSIDVVTESGSRYKTLVPPSLKYTDYCCINETEAQMITDIPLQDLEGEERKTNFQKACRALKELGVGCWAVIHSPRYCAGLDGGNEFHEIESIPLPPGFIKGSVGAGDAFVSGILYSIYRGKNLTEAMKLGEAVAVSSLSRKGATEGVGSLDEIMGLYRELGGVQPG